MTGKEKVFPETGKPVLTKLKDVYNIHK